MKVFVATFHGDLDEPPMVASSLDELLTDIQQVFKYGTRGEQDDEFHSPGFITPDPEDDKIEVHEYDSETKTSKIVWGFWGWHWKVPDGLEQGAMPNCKDSLYAQAMYDY